MRFLGVDAGQRRIGLALSDAGATLARPWMTVPAAGTARLSARQIALRLDDARDPFDDGPAVGGIVVGLPRRLDGRDNDQTGPARDLAAALAAETGLPVHLQDERLTSREAESRLAVREPDWKKRKALVDAAAAAIILQDFLDAGPHRPAPLEPAR